ncbi:AfsR/SARP family transcriptional regulator [Thermogemmatispora carboxidivorans]|uniref:AfsR/SARP family transcriptional regulator n=1 Tax=Thermogemmatispora carboxidivorans TaxID=1382306 RepID=UPI00069ACF08|nr:BTAD domain-containing putative transcriptional regulator [Thermogemmatispora carboxidivorans]
MITLNSSEPASALSEQIQTAPDQVPGDLQAAPYERMLATLQEIANQLLRVEQLLRAVNLQLGEVQEAWQGELATLKGRLHYLTEGGGGPERLHTVRTSPLSTDPQLGANAKGASSPGLAIISLQTHPRYLPSTEAGSTTPLPPLYITCFGRLTVRRLHAQGPLIQLCRNSKGQAILRYLLAQPQQQASIDMLMADLWPDEERETSRHKLQIAVSALRASLNREQIQSGGGYILYKEQTYLLNPAASFITDVAEFRRLFATGRQASDSAVTARCYEQACKLYSGPFLTEDLYAEWSFLTREELARVYHQMCTWLAEYALQRSDAEAALTWASLLLKLDHYDEEAYRKMMRAHSLGGRRNEVLRCYRQCCQTLREELGLEPLPETQRLFEQLLGAGTPSPLP